MATNPLIIMTGDPSDPVPLVELKSRLLLYLPAPPGPVTSRRLYDLYTARFGASVTGYRSTAFGSVPKPWTPAAQARFEHAELPALRQKCDWGYMLGDDRPAGARLFMFHGFRPVSEPGRASLVRIDFEWDYDPAQLFQFTAEVLEAVECLSGSGGWVLAPRVGYFVTRTAYNRMYALALRYWGAAAQDVESTATRTLGGYECVNWLTVIGPALRARAPEAVRVAGNSAHAVTEVNGHVLLQVEERPRLIDRNRRESLGRYVPVAEALLPLQIPDHPGFGGVWDEDNTMRYLRRFTHPDQV